MACPCLQQLPHSFPGDSLPLNRPLHTSLLVLPCCSTTMAQPYMSTVTWTGRWRGGVFCSLCPQAEEQTAHSKLGKSDLTAMVQLALCAKGGFVGPGREQCTTGFQEGSMGERTAAVSLLQSQTSRGRGGPYFPGTTCFLGHPLAAVAGHSRGALSKAGSSRCTGL